MLAHYTYTCIGDSSLYAQNDEVIMKRRLRFDHNLYICYNVANKKSHPLRRNNVRQTIQRFSVKDQSELIGVGLFFIEYSHTQPDGRYICPYGRSSRIKSGDDVAMTYVIAITFLG
jgi:hypothetical protein